MLGLDIYVDFSVDYFFALLPLEMRKDEFIFCLFGFVFKIKTKSLSKKCRVYYGRHVGDGKKLMNYLSNAYGKSNKKSKNIPQLKIGDN